LFWSLTVEVERSGIWRAAPPPHRRRRPKGEVPAFERPVRLKFPSGAALGKTTALPLPDASINAIECLDVLEYVRNDLGLIDELARVLSPHGELRLRVPATGVLAGIDSLNLMHYLVDVTHRGSRPHESSELGWRRHYSLEDLAGLLDPERFEIARVRRRGLAAAEIVTFAAMVLFRWLRPSVDHYRAWRRIARGIERVERRIVTPIGSVIEIVAIRRPPEIERPG
jgi:SAM-dependent methyltransferase